MANFTEVSAREEAENWVGALCGEPIWKNDEWERMDKRPLWERTVYKSVEAEAW